MDTAIRAIGLLILLTVALLIEWVGPVYAGTLWAAGDRFTCVVIVSLCFVLSMVLGRLAKS